MAISWKWYTLVLVVLDWIIVFIGVVGNLLLLIALTKYKTIQNPITRLLFINLTVSDIGVLVVRHSFQVIQIYTDGKWIFGELMCKLVPPVSRTFLSVSILTLVAISHHRYCCIVGVLKYHPSMRRTIILLTSTWASVLALYVGLDIPFRELDQKTQRCKDTISPMKYVAFVISEKAFYVLCFVCIFHMFRRIQKVLWGSLRFQEDSNIRHQFSPSVQTLRLLKPTVFVLLITLCPAWLLHIIAIMCHKVLPHRYLLYQVVGILMVCNSAGNPIIYAIMSRSFKHSFREILSSFWRVFIARRQNAQNDHCGVPLDALWLDENKSSKLM